jgi:GAF domain-containing protein
MSMLVVPMATPQGTVIGALQLINCKPDPATVFRTPADVVAHAIPFPARSRDLAASLASQAAVALENSRLYQSIQTLFEGFVQASVIAIESRDPTTSGHSFRVADFTVASSATSASPRTR